MTSLRKRTLNRKFCLRTCFKDENGCLKLALSAVHSKFCCLSVMAVDDSKFNRTGKMSATQRVFGPKIFRERNTDRVCIRILGRHFCIRCVPRLQNLTTAVKSSSTRLTDCISRLMSFVVIDMSPHNTLDIMGVTTLKLPHYG